MGRAKDIIVKPISAADANRIVKRLHYSGKVVNNSQVHLGVFLDGKCGGALQFGPSLDKRKLMGLVEGTKWNEFIELNRMALADWLPRNGESRAIAVAMRLLKKNYPWLKWVVSFADGCQCGDGTIYRASGFVLTGIKENTQIWRHECGATVSRTALTNLGLNGALKQRRELSSRFGVDFTNLSGASMREYESVGFRPVEGYQLRYLYFLDPTARERLTVPIIPFEEIEKRGASMYRGKKRPACETVSRPTNQPEVRGSTPTAGLSSDTSKDPIREDGVKWSEVQ